MEHAILFIPGLGCVEQSFQEIVEYARADDRLTPETQLDIFELPRSRPSQVPPLGSASVLEDIAQNIVTKLKGVDNVAIVGHSMGSVVGQFVAERSFPKVSHFVSIEGNMSYYDCGLISKRLVNDPDGEKFADLRSELSGTGGIGEKMWAAGVLTYEYSFLREYALDLVHKSKRAKLAQRYTHLQCQSLFIHGDDYLERGQVPANPILLELPADSVCHIEQARHFVMQDQPRETWRAISEFIRPLGNPPTF